MNVFAFQFDIAWENKPANFETVRHLLNDARPAKDSLVVLPEMFATGFSMNASAITEPYGGETEQFLARTAKEFGVCLIAGAAVRGRDGRARNKALVFSSAGELIAFYAKMRPFTLGGEPEHYAAGEKPTAFFWSAGVSPAARGDSTRGGWDSRGPGNCTVSPFICYDLRFPEIFREAAAAHRPELFAVIANYPDKRISHWVALLQARAIENQAYVVGVNRIGCDPVCTYNGRSIIVDPLGEILADAGARECCISAKLDLANLRKYRKGLPFLDDMRLER